MGIDIGGTFTDFVAENEETGAISTWKRLSTPSDPSIAFFDGLDELLSTMKSPTLRRQSRPDICAEDKLASLLRSMG